MGESVDIRAVACQLRHKAHWVMEFSRHSCRWCGVSGLQLSEAREPIIFTWSNIHELFFENIADLDDHYTRTYKEFL